MRSILKRLDAKSTISLTQEELRTFMDQAELVEDHDTYMCDHIRLYNCNGIFTVQETTDKKEILLHRFSHMSDASVFIEKRLETYERMWDGCGCKILYHDRKNRPPSPGGYM